MYKFVTLFIITKVKTHTHTHVGKRYLKQTHKKRTAYIIYMQTIYLRIKSVYFIIIFM